MHPGAFSLKSAVQISHLQYEQSPSHCRQYKSNYLNNPYLFCRAGAAAAAAAEDEDEEALPEEEENRPILPYSSFFILSSTNP